MGRTAITRTTTRSYNPFASSLLLNRDVEHKEQEIIVHGVLCQGRCVVDNGEMSRTGFAWSAGSP